MTETIDRRQKSGSGPTPDGQTKQTCQAPERPALAPNVELSGQMEDSAYAQQPWLVQRNGTFVQLTELLYRVVEQADGKRTLEEMADGVSEATGRGVSADNVRQLLETKLIPLGLVADADGSVVPQQDSGPRSPLQINMRVKMLGPQWINPFTAFLQWLYWPPVLIAVLAAAFAGQAWLFFVHGLAGSVRQALYHPGFMLALLGIIIVSTLWHEFGHASALRYGGGQVRGMGAGLYLVYPAFYTDVSDNYRLGRWARVRTDLGGFYFNLIFCLGMIGLYALTGQSFLLLIVFLTDIEILHQTLPFVRLDGYWTLADVTGLPDFFSQMKPFIRSMVPFLRKGESDRQMPALKTWVKVVFAMYIIITVPLLCALMFFMLKSAPRILATGWDSASLQIHVITHSHPGDYMGIALAGLQLLILALPTFGLIYMLIKLGRRIATGLWTWSKGSIPKRISACGIMAGILALLAWLWLPQVPLAPRGTAGPFYDRSTWRPIGPQERGTVPDAAPAVIGWRVPGNTSPPPTRTLSGTPRPTSQPNAVPGPKKTPTPKPTSQPRSTPRATPTPTVQASQSRNAPTSTPLPAATSTPEPTVVDTPTPAPTQPALPTDTPLATVPPTPLSTVPPTPVS